MAPETPREQEQSIKARKREIFEEEQVFGPRRPFSAYLAETEATPLTAGQKAAIWGVGVLVLSHYVEVGVEELSPEKLTPLLRLKYHDSLADAVADLGAADTIKTAFSGFQRYLYADAG